MVRLTEVTPEHTRNGSNLFQSPFWAEFKETRGYHTQAFDIDYQGKKTSIIMVHRPCAEDSGFGYVPYGPDIPIPQDRQGPFLERVSEKLQHRLPDRCRFLRYDLPWPNPYAREAAGQEWSGPPESRIREMRMNFGTRNWNLRKAPTDIQPPDTVILDLTRPASRILRGMHQKARNCVRTSFRRGVSVEVKGPEALPVWHRLYLEMAERKGIVAEGPAYFRMLFAAADRHGLDLRLYLAFKDDRLLAGSVIAIYNKTARYLFSASSPMGRRFMASYAILWRAVMDAKRSGCRAFDFFGIPPNGDPNHPLHGLYRFKVRFGGYIRHFRGCWDYPLDETRYPALAFSECNLNPYHLRR